MYECPNCGANLRFDITTQNLRCAYCETQVNPYDFQKEHDAEESTEYEVTLYTCPQCGGEIVSEDNTVAAFCSFCGSSTILDSRIAKERRPGYIIPFTKTKEDCKEAYRKMLRRSLFAPKEFREDTVVEHFRGIYMPYWVYSFAQSGPVSVNGSKSHQSGDYRITRHYRLDSQMDTECSGIAYDAAASFSDNISSAIAPFAWGSAKPFTPSFLSGFYADTSDVDEEIYRQDAINLALNESSRQMMKVSTYRKYGLNEKSSSVRFALQQEPKKVELAMFPVWFLANRHEDGVTYAVVNGQTGKVVADIPIDFKKYLLGSAILAVPLFILFNLLVSMRATTMLWIAAGLAFLCAILSKNQVSSLKTRELEMDDRGLAYRRAEDERLRREKEEREAGAYQAAMADVAGDTASSAVHTGSSAQAAGGSTAPDRSRVPDRRNSEMNTVFSALAKRMLRMVVLMFVMMAASGLAVFTRSPILLYWVMLMAPLVMMLSNIGRKPSKKSRSAGTPKITVKLSFKELLGACAKSGVALLLALAITIRNPVWDGYYYLGAAAVCAMTGWSVMDIIKRYNRLSKRPLPQFKRQGGDDRG